MKRIKFTRTLTSEDYLDITLFYEKGKIIKFALNYRAVIKSKIQPIYRVDNYHGFLHEQRLWRTKEPIPLNEAGLSNNQIVDKYVDEICLNFYKYKGYYTKSKK
ncbi:hypothetical protein JYT91_00180 [archaeon AH-315-M20]|nr:hypothetical protein [archaeon AH-315-M20]